MKIYLSSCDNYSHLLDGFSILFNHYSDNLNLEVIGLKNHSPKLPPNFSVTKSDSHIWGATMLNCIKEDYFILLLDDYWLNNRIELKNLEKSLDFVISNKIKRLGLRLCSATQYEDYNEDYLIVKQDSNYRMSLQPAIWDRKYFLSHIDNKWSPWDFEIKGSQKSLNDKELLLGSKKDFFPYVNVYKKGRKNLKDINRDIINKDSLIYKLTEEI